MLPQDLKDLFVKDAPKQYTYVDYIAIALIVIGFVHMINS